MKYAYLHFVIASFVFLILITTSCGKDGSYNYFLIPVDSVSAPDTVRKNETFEIVFWGLVGTNGCNRFSEFTAQQRHDEIVIEAWAKIKKNARFCPSVMVYLRGKKMEYSISEPGEYLIKVKQAANSYLQHSVVVRE